MFGNRAGKKINWKINLKSTLCACKNISSTTLPCAKTPDTQSVFKAARRKSLEPTGIKRTESRARNKPNEEEWRGDCPGIHGVIKGLSGGAHPGGDSRCADWRLQRWPSARPPLRPSVRPSAVKSPPNFKAAPTATTALTPQRRRQIVEGRDPISKHHVTGNRGQ